MSAVVINSGLVHYEAFGRGSPILFIHGWLGSWRYWMQAMESLAVEHRVYALDLWGFGDSDKTEKRFDVEQYVSLIANFTDNLGIEQPLLVGHALGAGVAVEYANRYMNAVHKIVAVSLPLDAKAIDRRLASFNNTSMLSKVFRWKPIPSKEIEMEAERAAESVIPLSLKSFSRLNITEKLASLNCQLLLVYGEKDDVVDPSPVKALNDGLKRTKYIGMPESKHFPMLDESSKFNRLLKDFFAKDASIESLDIKEEWRRRIR